MRTVVWWLILVLAVLTSAASLAPLIETNVWWIRVLDFPRLQYVAVLLIAAVLLPLLHLRSRGTAFAVLLIAAALIYNGYKLHPYRPGADMMALAPPGCDDASRLSVLVVNVRKGNRDAAPLIALVRSVQPDLFLAMETDSWWDERLRELEFATSIQHVDGGYFGMHLFSDLPLADSSVRFLADQTVPSIFTTVRLESGASVRFIGVHPRPPHPLESSTGRDAQLLTEALEARSWEEPTILAGDFNAVPWERVVRRTMRLGGFLDPRVGRGFLATYDAGQPLMRWPLDQVLFQNRLGLTDMVRLEDIGSDHFPYLVEVCHAPDMAGRQSAPAPAQDDIMEAERSIRLALNAGQGQATSGAD